MKAMLTYSFIFDPAELWQATGDCDTDLALFFRDKGYEMEVIKESEDTPYKDYKKIIYLKKIEQNLI